MKQFNPSCIWLPSEEDSRNETHNLKGTNKEHNPGDNIPSNCRSSSLMRAKKETLQDWVQEGAPEMSGVCAKTGLHSCSCRSKMNLKGLGKREADLVPFLLMSTMSGWELVFFLRILVAHSLVQSDTIPWELKALMSFLKLCAFTALWCVFSSLPRQTFQLGRHTYGRRREDLLGWLLLWMLPPIFDQYSH